MYPNHSKQFYDYLALYMSIGKNGKRF
ncbi:MAG: hypothetical protein M0Q20_06305 [Sulfurimonas sp.]|nr:hypothetical protein [Sulfurimonas sp.]MCK9454749.1 hypothetical protein [Sulfurimonas sp.]